MKNIVKVIFTLSLVFIAFSCGLNANAAPEIFVGLTLNYDYTTIDATADIEVIQDQGTYWSASMLMTMNSVPVMDVVSTVNKTASQNTYNYTFYQGVRIVGSGDGYMFWIDTTGLSIGENISIEGGQFKIMEQIQVTVPKGTYTVFNATESNDTTINHYYYDVTTGFVIKAESPLDNLIMVLQNSNFISEFPVHMLPILILAIPIAIKYSNTIKKS